MTQPGQQLHGVCAVRRPLREELYRAFVTRAASGETDNTPLIERTLALRQELAALLGYPNYAEVSLASKVGAAAAVPALRRAALPGMLGSAPGWLLYCVRVAAAALSRLCVSIFRARSLSHLQSTCAPGAKEACGRQGSC